MEKEIKIRIPTKEGFDAMMSLLPAPFETVEQKNYYFDTPELHYANAHCLLRLRQAKEKYIITFKRGRSLSDGYFQADEDEITVSEGEAADIIANPERILQFNPGILPAPDTDEKVQLLGIAVTIRSKIRFQGFIVEADVVEFPNGNIDYEVEVETGDPDGVRALLYNLLTRNDIEYTPQEHTKYQRFLYNLPG